MRVGFVGVGAMGNPMASHVLDSGQFDDVYVYDLSKSAVGRMVGKCSRAFPTYVESHQPAPPPGRPWDRTLWAAGWGSGLVQFESETL